MRRTENILTVADLPKRKVTEFLLTPSVDEIAQLVTELGLLSLRKLRLEGQITPIGLRDYKLVAKLGATVTQPCVVTLEPVVTRIDVTLTRRYSDDARPEYGEGEFEVPQDDALEPLGNQIDLFALLQEELALALPLYPRKDAEDFDGLAVAQEGVAPLKDEDLRPFAGLAGLRDKLAGGDSDK